MAVTTGGGGDGGGWEMRKSQKWKMGWMGVWVLTYLIFKKLHKWSLL